MNYPLNEDDHVAHGWTKPGKRCVQHAWANMLSPTGQPCDGSSNKNIHTLYERIRQLQPHEKAERTSYGRADILDFDVDHVGCFGVLAA
jgi:hypothetical protein